VTLERRAWVIAHIAVALLLIVSARVIYWQLVRSSEFQPTAVNLIQAAGTYSEHQDLERQGGFSVVRFLLGITTVRELDSLPQPVIQRTIDLLNSITRGSMYDRGGRLLASDQIGEDGKPQRFYSEPSLAHTLGYTSGIRTGVSGLELYYNQMLLGLDRPDTLVNRTLNKHITGSDLILTIDTTIQRAAESALRGRAGAIVVLDGRSGAVLASASAPRFDPNRILDAEYVSSLMESCGSNPLCQAPFLNRSSQALYPPGSTWKTVALIAALDSGQVRPDTLFDFGEPVRDETGSYFVYRVDGGTIPDPNHSDRQLNLEMSYAKSANAAFARIGDEMPPDTLVDYAARFGFGAPGQFPYRLDIESNSGQLANSPRELYDNNLLRAVTAIGQGELLASPLQMGMVVLPVLNNGDMPLPYLVEAVVEPGGRTVSRLPNRRTYHQLMKPVTAQEVKQMMVRTVTHGSGQAARIPGALVGGKTGTAQVGGGLPPHAWFTGFAENNTLSIVVVVLIEHGGQGSQIAAPVFAEVAAAALAALGGDPVESIPQAQPSRTPVAPTEQSTATQAPTQTPQSAITQVTPPPQLLEPSAMPTPAFPGVPAPDILRDPDKNDISTENPSCANMRDMPEATGKFMWPSAYQALSGGDFREGHPGLDLSAPNGTPVYAADTGLVVFAGWSRMGYGNVILIDHGNGYQTLYAHLSQISMHCGARVEKGKLIGLSGNTGNSTGPHLHFEVRVPGGWIDPLRVLPTP
jgi:penicillin-binding protein A